VYPSTPPALCAWAASVSSKEETIALLASLFIACFRPAVVEVD
jgi:hypothetical protein